MLAKTWRKYSVERQSAMPCHVGSYNDVQGIKPRIDTGYTAPTLAARENHLREIMSLLTLCLKASRRLHPSAL